MSEVKEGTGSIERSVSSKDVRFIGGRSCPARACRLAQGLTGPGRDPDGLAPEAEARGLVSSHSSWSAATLKHGARAAPWPQEAKSFAQGRYLEGWRQSLSDDQRK